MCIRDRICLITTFKREEAAKTHPGPSLNQSFWYLLRQDNQTKDKTITSNYLKNIRDDLLEEESANTTYHNNEITY